jgi:hypothetical protein
MIPIISKSKIGFRLSQVDILVLFLCCLVTYYFPKNWLYPKELNSFFNFLIPYVVANFLLFCNIFRVRTKYELCWISSAAINMLICLCYFNNFNMFFLVQSCFTLVAIVFEIKSPTYHGIFAKKTEENL